MKCFLIYQTFTIPYIIVPSPKRKTITITITKCEGVCVRIPSYVDISTVQQWVDTKKEWILRVVKQYKILEFIERKPLESLQYLGIIYPLCIQLGNRNSIVKKDNVFYVEIKDPTKEYIQRFIAHWLKKKAEYIFSQIYESCFCVFLDFCQRLLPNQQRWYGKDSTTLGACKKPVLRIYMMKTKYGSLRQNGTLTLNTRLIHAPYECIEFVLFHELAHVIEFNHSPRFYEILSLLCPQWKKHQQWLNEELIAI